MTNIFFDFNPHRYKDRLSPFGRKVLDVMLIRSMQDYDRNRKSYQHQETKRFQKKSYDVRNQRILTFKDSHSENNKLPLTFNYEPIFYPNDRINEPLDRNNFVDDMQNYGNESHYVPTSFELIKSATEKYVTEDSSHYLREDLLQTSFCRKQRESQYKIKCTDEIVNSYNNQDGENKSKIEISHFEVLNKTNSLKLNDCVKWGDMFDIDILPDTDNENNKLENAYSLENSHKKATTEIKIISNEIISTTTDLKKHIKKRKYPKNSTVSAPPKKFKKTPPENVKKTTNTLKKYKTKTVENWLQNIDPCNTVEEKITTNLVNEEIHDTNLSNSNKGGIIEVKKAPKEKSNKKVVQSQLANKNGVMKFKTPNTKIIDIVEKETNVNQTSVRIENCVKDKKSKFIAPIKSQVPVKDVAFEIITLDSQNIGTFLSFSHKLYDNEIRLTLLYSNGFCQLNNQHTDDACDAEGFMINFENSFLYIKQVNFGDKTQISKLLQMLLTRTKIVCYEAKNLLIYFATQFDLEIKLNQYNIIDVKIGGNLLDPDNPPENFTVLQKLLSFTPEYTIATECILQKAAWYISLLKECSEKLRSILTCQSLWNVFINIEMRLLPLIADMERRGVNVNLEKLKSMESLLLNKIIEVEQECYKAAGKTFQINSTVQVRAILYDELKLDSKSNVKIRETITTGAKSTSESMLRSLMSLHPLPQLILKYRHLHKALATFVTGIAQQVKNGVVKPIWVQTAAATGRIASNNPNLQAIPKAPFNLNIFPDLDDKDNQQLNFRSVYIARPGFKLLAADFQHIECRVFAHAAADTGLLEILRGGGDLFRVLASKWLKKTEKEVSSEDRERTKRIVYASLYGAGTRKLMEILNVSYDQTLSIVASFNRTFPSLKSFGRSVVSKCEANIGKLKTLCGRARYFKHIMSKEFSLKSHAERQAVNFIVQGSAADLCKMAMVLTEDSLKSSTPPIEGHMVLQIHDELVWEISDADVERAADIIRNVMETCGHHCGLPLQLPVALSYGQNWGEMEKILPKAL